MYTTCTANIQYCIHHIRASPYKITSVREIWLLLDTHRRSSWTLLLFRQTLYVPSAPAGFGDIWQNIGQTETLIRNPHDTSTSTRTAAAASSSFYQTVVINILCEGLCGLRVVETTCNIIYIIIIIIIISSEDNAASRSQYCYMVFRIFVWGGLFFVSDFPPQQSSWSRDTRIIAVIILWHRFSPMNFVRTISAFKPYIAYTCKLYIVPCINGSTVSNFWR